MDNFVTFLSEEKYNIPIGNEEDLKTFNTDLNKKDLQGVIDLLSKYTSEIAIAGGDGGSIKLRINTSSVTDDQRAEIKAIIKDKYPNLKYKIGQGSLSKKSGGIDWTTESMETAQCLGVYVNGLDLLNDVKKAAKDPSALSAMNKKWIKELTSTLGNGNDWDKTGKKYLTTILKSGMTLDRWIDVGSLIAGMSIFVNKVFKADHIIHGSINTYYKAEESNQLIQGNKDNTADMILSSVPAKELISLMKSNKATYDNKGVCSIGKAKFIQVSLKKAKGGAQLGKITSNIKDKYNISDYASILHNVIGEGFVAYQLDEGKLLDALKSLGSKFAGAFKKLITNVTKFASKFYSNLSKRYKKQLKADIVEFNKMLKEEELYESKINVLISKMSDKDVNNLLVRTQHRINDLMKIISSQPHLAGKYNGNIKPSKMTVDDKMKLFSNYTTVKILQDMIKASAGTSKKLANDLVELQKEMFFGKTMLPVYKVYGGDSGKTYEYLGSGEDFMIKNTKVEDTPLLGVWIGGSKDNYYVIYSAFFLGVNDQGEPIYSENRMGTNRAGAFSYVIEGVTQLSQEKFNNKYN